MHVTTIGTLRFIPAARESLKYCLDLEVPTVWDIMIFFAPWILVALGVLATLVTAALYVARKANASKH